MNIQINNALNNIKDQDDLSDVLYGIKTITPIVSSLINRSIVMFGNDYNEIQCRLNSNRRIEIYINENFYNSLIVNEKVYALSKAVVDFIARNLSIKVEYSNIWMDKNSKTDKLVPSFFEFENSGIINQEALLDWLMKCHIDTSKIREHYDFCRIHKSIGDYLLSRGLKSKNYKLKLAKEDIYNWNPETEKLVNKCFNQKSSIIDFDTLTDALQDIINCENEDVISLFTNHHKNIIIFLHSIPKSLLMDFYTKALTFEFIIKDFEDTGKISIAHENYKDVMKNLTHNQAIITYMKNLKNIDSRHFYQYPQ